MQFLVNNKNFIVISFISIAVVLWLALYVANLLFGKNSYEVYVKLVNEKKQLQYKIKQLQKENAKLQKQYLELKNLEPEIL